MTDLQPVPSSSSPAPASVAALPADLWVSLTETRYLVDQGPQTIRAWTQPPPNGHLLRTRTEGTEEQVLLPQLMAIANSIDGQARLVDGVYGSAVARRFPGAFASDSAFRLWVQPHLQSGAVRFWKAPVRSDGPSSQADLFSLRDIERVLMPTPAAPPAPPPAVPPRPPEPPTVISAPPSTFASPTVEMMDPKPEPPSTKDPDAFLTFLVKCAKRRAGVPLTADPAEVNLIVDAIESIAGTDGHSERRRPCMSLLVKLAKRRPETAVVFGPEEVDLVVDAVAFHDAQT